jgi:hypothetical protein
MVKTVLSFSIADSAGGAMELSPVKLPAYFMVRFTWDAELKKPLIIILIVFYDRYIIFCSRDNK